MQAGTKLMISGVRIYRQVSTPPKHRSLILFFSVLLACPDVLRQRPYGGNPIRLTRSRNRGSERSVSIRKSAFKKYDKSVDRSA